MTIQTVNPATGEIINTYAEMSCDEIGVILKQIKNAQEIWKNFSFSERREKMFNVAKLLEKNKEQYATLIAKEMGKPIIFARAEIEKCQWVCQYYADQAEQYLLPQSIKSDHFKSYVTYHPLGIIYAIMPWNFPFWQVFRFAAPNLMAGNACLLSHAKIVTGCGLAIEQLFQEAQLPMHCFRTVLVDHDVSKKIMTHEDVAGVTLTGSERAGSIVGSQAGTSLKKVVLELGGNDPYIILADADLENAAEHIVKSRMNNSGQVCISAKRIISEASIHDHLLNLIVEKLKAYCMGDPLNESTNMGPLARENLRETTHDQVLKSVHLGAKLICGGFIPKGEGFYYPPTLLSNVIPGMPAFDDEIFGPVIAMISAKDEVEAIQLANQSRFGLSAAVFTRNIEKGERIACDEINVGTCYVNGMVSSDPRLPFGGIKASGYGRELSVEGSREFTNIKTICVVENT